RELRPCREQRREMKDALDGELRQDALEQIDVGDRAGELACDERRERLVERDDRRSRRRKPRDETVADLAAGAGDEDDRFTHTHSRSTQRPWNRREVL